jgi:hypothetical protein
VGLQSGYRVEGFLEKNNNHVRKSFSFRAGTYQVPDDDILVSITVRGGEGGERRERR